MTPPLDLAQIIGLPLQQALHHFPEDAPSIVEIQPPRGRKGNARGALRVLRYDHAKHELMVSRFIDTVAPDDPAVS